MTKVGAELGEQVKNDTSKSTLFGPFIFAGPLIAYFLIILSSVFYENIAIFFIMFFYIAIPVSYFLGFFPALLTLLLVEARIEKSGYCPVWLAAVFGGMNSVIFIIPFFSISRIIEVVKFGYRDLRQSDFVFLICLFALGFFTTAILMLVTHDRQNKIAIAYGFEPPHKNI